jgi:hypothetical protein
MSRKKRDPGAYIGHEPELAAETIPGGVRPDDERVAANSSQPGVVEQPAPEGHREGPPAGDDQVRGAGQDR